MATDENSTLTVLENQIARDVYRALRILEQPGEGGELYERPNAAERLPEIAELADKLATALDVFCDAKPAGLRTTGKIAAFRSRPAESDDADERDRPAITVLVGDHVNAIHGLQAVCQALVNLDENESIGLAIAAREFAAQIAGGTGSLVMETERQIESATGMKVRQ